MPGTSPPSTHTPRADGPLPRAGGGHRRRRARWCRHGLLSAACTAAALGIWALLPAESPVAYRLSLATAYPALALLSTTLMLGPLNVLLGRANPVSFDARRDVAIWAALLSLAHVPAGLSVHLGGRYWAYFLDPDAPRDPIPLRLDAFGIANHAGLLLTVVLVILLALSNDASLRRLGARRWKGIQRLAYPGYAALVAHALMYPLLEGRPSVIAIPLVAAAIVATVQLAGFRRFRARRR